MYSLRFPLLATSFLAINPILSTLCRSIIIRNKCPLPINLIINGESQGPLYANGGETQREYPDWWSGFIYTDAARGGAPNTDGLTRAGFYGEDDYYYIVIDQEDFNVGVSISTNGTQDEGFCGEIECNTVDCENAFRTPPTNFPPPTDEPPEPPVFGCPQNAEYTVTFCPTNEFPHDTFFTIHPNGNPDKCLDVQGAQYENGTPVQIYDCNGTGAQRWRVNGGATQIFVDGTNFCLDAGASPGSGVGMKIWQCYDDLPAQEWFYTDQATIQLDGQGQCLDLTDGGLWNGNQVQTWECAPGNPNQIWTVA
ncbi:hypothetical protein AX16_004504 [Volvariella volvacea WC 439]|nr:hypothetical protein AX16_004504 [Volvariella volvacea WC 439]